MELKTHVRHIPTVYIETEFGEFHIHSVSEIIEALEDCGPLNPIVIYYPKIKEWLESLDIIHANVRGSVYVKDEEKYKELVAAIEKILYGDE